MNKLLSFKKDAYRNNRGNYSRKLDISCRKCNKHVCFYQKDGPGNLRRMYFDRIFDIKPAKLLECKKCGELLGITYNYHKENRKAYKLFVDAVKKKVVKLN